MKTTLTTTGIEIGLSVPKGAMEALVAARYAAFLGTVNTPSCSVRIEPTDGVDHPTETIAVVERRLDTVFEISHPSFTGTIDLEGEGILRCVEGPYALDHSLRTLFALLAPRHRALMLNATGVISRGGAHVFTGPSGPGKSTVARLAGNRPVLTDGYVMVRRSTDGAWLAGSTPFSSSYDVPRVARDLRLDRLWSLRPSPRLRSAPSDAGAALRAVVESLFLPVRDPGFRKPALDLALELASAVPSSELGFVPAPGLWLEIEASVA